MVDMRSQRLPVVGNAADTGGTDSERGPLPLSARERASLNAIARAIMLAGAVLPQANDRAVDGAVRFLAQAPRVLSGYRAILFGFEAAARLRYGRAIASLDDSRLKKLIE